MTSKELAKILRHSGRHRVGPIVERYLEKLNADGFIKCPNPKRAFEVLYGLAINDLQIRVLLGESAPSKKEINARADQAVMEFLVLYAPS